MAALAFSMLALLTMGIPTLLFLTPVVARIWYALSVKLDTIESAE